METKAKIVADRFSDPAAYGLKKEMKAILQNSKLGRTEEERKKKFRTAVNLAIGYNIGAIGFCILLVALHLEPIWVGVIHLVPLIGFLILIVNNGIIKVMSRRKKDIYPSLSPGLVVSCGLSLGSFPSDYRLLEMGSVFPPGLITGGCIFILLAIPALIRSARIGSPVLPAGIQALFLLVLSLCYGFGMAIFANCAFDRSPAQVFEPTVTQMHVSTGREIMYHMTLSLWGPQKEEKEIVVDYSIYNSSQIGDPMIVEYRPGLLHIPWYFLSK